MDDGALKEHGHVKALAPGMRQVIEAGMAYTVTDVNGVETEFVGKLDVETVAFIRAYDQWIIAYNKLGSDAEPVKHAWSILQEKYHNLPTHVTRELIRR